MENGVTSLQKRIQSGKPLLLAEMSPPCGSDPSPLRELARRFAGKVHAMGVSDNRERVAMSAMAAAAILAGEGLEPILHVVTRDRNRIALVSEALGAQALGIRNLLCTSGSHQSLGAFQSARNVFDIDAIQLLQTYAGLGKNGSLVGEQGIAGAGPFCLSGVAAPSADPVEFQLVRLEKKIAAGAQLLITQPIFDMERFDRWWQEVTRRKLHERVAIVAGIELVTTAEEGQKMAAARPSPRMPASFVDRLTSASGAAAQRAAGIAMAKETIDRLKSVKGLRGFEIAGNGDMDAALEVIEQSGLGIN